MLPALQAVIGFYGEMEEPDLNLGTKIYTVRGTELCRTGSAHYTLHSKPALSPVIVFPLG